MKYILMISCIAAFQLTTNAQTITEASVPNAVKENLNKVCLNPTVDKWEIENGNYKANFMKKGIENSALFAADGKFLQYGYVITANDVPDAAKNYVNTNLPGKTISKVTKIREVTGDISYVMEVGENNYIFDYNGNYLRMEKKNLTEEK